MSQDPKDKVSFSTMVTREAREALSAYCDESGKFIYHVVSEAILAYCNDKKTAMQSMDGPESPEADKAHGDVRPRPLHEVVGLDPLGLIGNQIHPRNFINPREFDSLVNSNGGVEDELRPTEGLCWLADSDPFYFRYILDREKSGSKAPVIRTTGLEVGEISGFIAFSAMSGSLILPKETRISYNTKSYYIGSIDDTKRISRKTAKEEARKLAAGVLDEISEDNTVIISSLSVSPLMMDDEGSPHRIVSMCYYTIEGNRIYTDSHEVITAYAGKEGKSVLWSDS